MASLAAAKMPEISPCALVMRYLKVVLFLTRQDIFALADGRPAVQADEIRAFADDIAPILASSESSGGPGAPGQVDLQTLITRLYERYQESHLGQLDFSVFFGIEPSTWTPFPDVLSIAFEMTVDEDTYTRLSAMSKEEQFAWLRDHGKIPKRHIRGGSREH